MRSERSYHEENSYYFSEYHHAQFSYVFRRLQYAKRSEKEEILQISESKKMKKALENFLKGLDPKALTPEGKIKSYEIQKDKLDYNPMGGLNVYIIINGNEVLNIDMTVQEEDTGEYEVVSYGIPQELSELLGEN